MATAAKASLPLIIKLVVVVVVVLGGGGGAFAVVAIVTDHVAQNPPAAPTTPAAEPCPVTPAELDKAHPVQPAHYLAFNCYDRYVLATANTDPRITDDLRMTFEFKNGSWQWTGNEGTFLKCGTIPQAVWQHWNETCIQDPVSCDGNRLAITIISGPVDCATVGSIADRYDQLLTAGQVDGQGHFATIDDWECDWPYVDGIPHSETYHECTRKADGAVFRMDWR